MPYPQTSLEKESQTPLQDLAEDFLKEVQAKNSDPVNHPRHYNKHPSGVECIQVTEHMSFNLGNCVKYIWRAGEKGNRIEDLKKAAWYVNREIQLLEKSIEQMK
jgi:hypothetical protein